MSAPSSTPAAGGESRAHLGALTSLRYLAALLVVFFHCGGGAFADSPVWFRALINNGYQAVSFFFVLSGFVLMYSYSAPSRPTGLRTSRARFWIARFAHIYPMYVFALALAAAPFLYKVLHHHQMSLGWFAGAVVAVPLLMQSWIPKLALAWNTPAWSLSVEACFYLLFPFLARPLQRGDARGRVMLMVGVCVLAHGIRHLCFPLPESGASTPSDAWRHPFFAYFPLLHLPTFLLGMSLGRLFSEQQASRPFVSSPLGLLALVGILTGLFCFHGRISPVFLSDMLLVPYFGLLVYWSAALPASSVLSHPRLVELGEASYGLYLIHSPLWFIAFALASPLGLGGHRDGLAFFSMFTISVTIVSVLGFRYLETPARKYLTRTLNHRFAASERP